MPLVSTIVRCCVHIVRLVCGRKDGRTEGQTKYSNPPAHAPRVNDGEIVGLTNLCTDCLGKCLTIQRVLVAGVVIHINASKLTGIKAVVFSNI